MGLTSTPRDGNVNCGGGAGAGPGRAAARRIWLGPGGAAALASRHACSDETQNPSCRPPRRPRHRRSLREAWPDRATRRRARVRPGDLDGILRFPMPLTVAWISDYPIEWMPDPPPPLRGLPRKHPETWMSVLLGELMGSADLKIHVLVLRGRVERGFEFERNGVRFHVLKASRSQRLLSLFWVDTLLLRRALRRIQPAVVHAWGNEYAAGLIATRLGYPYLVTIQGLLTWYRETVPVPAYGRFTASVESLCLKRAPLATTESRFA